MKKILLFLLAGLFVFGCWRFTKTYWFKGLILNASGPFPSYGPSMEPTLRDGMKYFVKDGAIPHMNDIISFECKKDICHNYNGEIHQGYLIKRLIKVDDKDCWWVEGDNKNNSFDSRHFGWVCPNERLVEGVVILAD